MGRGGQVTLGGAGGFSPAHLLAAINQLPPVQDLIATQISSPIASSLVLHAVCTAYFFRLSRWMAGRLIRRAGRGICGRCVGGVASPPAPRSIAYAPGSPRPAPAARRQCNGAMRILPVALRFGDQRRDSIGLLSASHPRRLAHGALRSQLAVATTATCWPACCCGLPLVDAYRQANTVAAPTSARIARWPAAGNVTLRSGAEAAGWPSFCATASSRPATSFLTRAALWSVADHGRAIAKRSCVRSSLGIDTDTTALMRRQAGRTAVRF
jgi:hypothetical protein